MSERTIERVMAIDGPGWIAGTLIVPVAGALLAGLALTYLVPNARGSGVPQVKVAYRVQRRTARASHRPSRLAAYHRRARRARRERRECRECRERRARRESARLRSPAPKIQTEGLFRYSKDPVAKE